VGDAEDLLAGGAEIDVALAQDASEPAAEEMADRLSAVRTERDLGQGLLTFDHDGLLVLG